MDSFLNPFVDPSLEGCGFVESLQAERSKLVYRDSYSEYAGNT